MLEFVLNELRTSIECINEHTLNNLNFSVLQILFLYSSILGYWIFYFHELLALIIKRKKGMFYFTCNDIFEISKQKKRIFSRFFFFFLDAPVYYYAHYYSNIYHVHNIAAEILI